MSTIAKIEAHRAKAVAPLKAQLGELRATGPSRAEQFEALLVACEHADHEGSRALAAHVASGDAATMLTVMTERGDRVDLAPVLAALLGSRVLFDRVTGISGDSIPEGMPSAERAKRIADLEAQLLKAENTEEDLIRAAEASGVVVTRRADADPRAVLRNDEGQS